MFAVNITFSGSSFFGSLSLSLHWLCHSLYSVSVSRIGFIHSFSPVLFHLGFDCLSGASNFIASLFCLFFFLHSSASVAREQRQIKRTTMNAKKRWERIKSLISLLLSISSVSFYLFIMNLLSFLLSSLPILPLVQFFVARNSKKAWKNRASLCNFMQLYKKNIAMKPNRIRRRRRRYNRTSSHLLCVCVCALTSASRPIFYFLIPFSFISFYFYSAFLFLILCEI